MRILGLFLLIVLVIPQLFSCASSCECDDEFRVYYYIKFDTTNGGYSASDLDSIQVAFRTDTNILYHTSELSVYDNSSQNYLNFPSLNGSFGSRSGLNRFNLPMYLGNNDNPKKLNSILFYLQNDTVEFYNMDYEYKRSSKANCRCITTIKTSGRLNGNPYTQTAEAGSIIEYFINKK